MRTILGDAIAVHVKRVSHYFEPPISGYFLLSPFNFFIKKFLDTTTLVTNEMVMVISLIELVDRFPRFKMVAYEYSGLFELR